MYGTTFGMCASQCAAIMFEATDLDRFPQAMAIANVMFGVANFIGGFLGGITLHVDYTSQCLTNDLPTVLTCSHFIHVCR